MSRQLAATVLVALSVAACNRQSPRILEQAATRPPVTAVRGADGVQTATLEANDGFKFSPSEVIAAPGRLRIVLQNSGATPHNLILPSLHKGTADASGGQSVVLTVTVKAGAYQFLCSYHRDLGMTGQLIVR